MVSNIGKITDLAGTPSKGLVDGTDKLHSGIIKVLESFSQDNICVSHAGFTITDGGTYTQYNLAQPIKFRANGQYVSYTGGNLTVAYSSTVQDGTNSRYDWVLLNPNIGGTPAIVIVKGTAGTTPLVSDITAGYIPIALVHISAGTDDDKFDYSFQTFTMNLSKNSISIGRDSSGYTESLSIVSNAGDVEIQAKEQDKDIIFKVNDGGVNTEVLRLDGSTGNLGIRLSHNTTAEERLDVEDGNISLTTTARQTERVIKLRNSGSTTSLSEIAFAGANTNNYEGYIAFKTKGPADAYDQALNEIMRVDGDGDVGIGTTDPDEKLHVVGNVKITNDLTLGGGDIAMGNGQDSTIKIDATTSSTAGRDLTIEAGSSATGSANIDGGDLILKAGGGDGTGTSIMTFSTKVSGTDAVAEKMRISTIGNVGIGNTAPTQKLTVSGSMGAAGFVGAVTEVTGGPGPGGILNLSTESHRTVIANTVTLDPSVPSGGPLSLTLPAASGTHQGWEMRIVAKASASGADALTLAVTGSSDLIIDATGATIGNNSSPFTLVTGKVYSVIHVNSTMYMCIILN
tara:strand:+ start:3287 stop:4996 length:1710 start_codon:yes stop_codon:yes gene_type:complete